MASHLSRLDMLVAQLGAFQSLPGTALLEIENHELREIRETLREIPADVDAAIAILSVRHAEIVARFAVQHSLEDLRISLLGYVRARGSILDLEPLLQSDLWSDDWKTLFDGLRRNAPPGMLRTNRPSWDYETDLRLGLMSLPENEDPIAWAKGNRIHDCARIAIRQAIYRSLPTGPDALGSVERTVRTDKTTVVKRFGTTIEITLREVMVHKLGLKVVVSIGAARELPTPSFYLVNWTGFSDVRDGEGARYIELRRAFESDSVRGAAFSFDFYSGIATVSKKLELRSEHSRIELGGAIVDHEAVRVLDLDLIVFEVVF